MNDNRIKIKDLLDRIKSKNIVTENDIDEVEKLMGELNDFK